MLRVNLVAFMEQWGRYDKKQKLLGFLVLAKFLFFWENGLKLKMKGFIFIFIFSWERYRHLLELSEDVEFAYF